MENDTRDSAPIRPYFMPRTIDFDSLPEDVKTALSAIVQPAYDELVLGAVTALERSAGATITFLLALEVLDHFQIGHTMNLSGMPCDEQDAARREKDLNRYLRVVTSKQKAAGFLLRLQQLRRTIDPVHASAI